MYIGKIFVSIIRYNLLHNSRNCSLSEHAMNVLWTCVSNCLFALYFKVNYILVYLYNKLVELTYFQNNGRSAIYYIASVLNSTIWCGFSLLHHHDSTIIVIYNIILLCSKRFISWSRIQVFMLCQMFVMLMWSG
jgi:hypothetical protein